MFRAFFLRQASLWQRAYARNVRLYYPYRRYTNLIIFRFVSEHCLCSTLYAYLKIMPSWTIAHRYYFKVKWIETSQKREFFCNCFDLKNGFLLLKKSRVSNKTAAFQNRTHASSNTSQLIMYSSYKKENCINLRWL